MSEGNTSLSLRRWRYLQSSGRSSADIVSGKKIELEVGEDSYVEEIIYLLEKKVEVPIDNDRLVLLYGGKQMQEGCRISDYEVRR